MDVEAYLSADPEAKFTLLAMYFLREEAYGRAKLAIAQLAKSNPKRARVLSHRRELDMLDYATATALYLQHSDWPGTTHLAQAKAMMEIGAYDEARAALKLAGDAEGAGQQMERLDHLQGIRPDLTQPLRADSGEWLLMARAAAGAERRLAQWAENQTDLPAETSVYLNRSLAHYFAMQHDEVGLQAAAQALAADSSKLGEKLVTIAEKALEAEHFRFASLAIQQIDAMGAAPEGLAKLKSKLGQVGS